ncbi:MAG: SusC/RagA family TonB-linked outer membrane protein [Solitalea-like symbiont of Tyrophagus putrescentiae]
MKYLFFTFTLLAFNSTMKIKAQEQKIPNIISGTVTAVESNKPIPNAIIKVVGSKDKTETDKFGNYIIAPNNGQKLLITATHFKPITVPIGSEPIINVNLVESIDTTVDSNHKRLSSVLITALGSGNGDKQAGYSYSNLEGRELSEIPSGNLANNLSGKVAGVEITTASSGAGGSTKVTIRGNKSLAGNNQPLYVIDGVPMDNTNLAGNVNSATSQYNRSDYGSGISDINPDDIESMEVLKGPNAAALYGSRAANGVILITTKRASAGQKLGISYSTSITLDNALILPEYQNEYGQGTRGKIPSSREELLSATGSWGGKLDSTQQPYFDGTKKAYLAQPNNVKDFFKTGQTYVNTIALETSSEKTALRFSYSKFNNGGIIPSNKLQKDNFNIRANSSFINNKLLVDGKATYFIQRAYNRPMLGATSSNAINSLFLIPRNVDIHDLHDERYSDGRQKTWGSLIQNPYFTTNISTNNDSKNRFIGMASAKYLINDKLNALIRAGTDHIQQQITSISPIGSTNTTKGSINLSSPNLIENNFDALISYNNKISSKWSLSANIGASVMYRQYDALYANGNNFLIPNIESINTVQEKTSSRTFYEKQINSLYAYTQLGFLEYLFVNLSGRNDWSSALPKTNRSYFYPAINTSLVLSDMPEWKKLDLSWVNLAIIRLGWAQVGSDTDPYQVYYQYAVDTNPFLGVIGISDPLIRPNSNLKAEITSSFESGLETQFLDGLIYTDITFYRSDTKNQIVVLALPPSSGYNKEIANIGNVRNSGLEILLGGFPIKGSKFSWESSFNMAFNKNQLVSLINNYETYQLTKLDNIPLAIMATVGGGYGDIYGTDYKRNVNGQIIVDSQGYPLATDMKKLGNSQPVGQLGFNNTFRYNDFTLKFLIDARIGGKVFSYTDLSMTTEGVSIESLNGRENGIIVDGIDEAGNKNTTSVSAENYYNIVNQRITSRYLYDATNVRLRELTLSYKIPVSKIKNLNFVQSATVSLIARNLFFIYKTTKNIDPESNFSTGNAQGIAYFDLPSTRNFGLSLNVNF